MNNGTKKTCAKGHVFYKSSDCPVCPRCEKEKAVGAFGDVGAPVRRALAREGIATLKLLAKWKESDILSLHGVGPSAIPKLRKKLKDAGLGFKG